MSEAGGRCPQCGRPVAMARPRCVYCGTDLPAAEVEAATAAREALTPAAAPEVARALIIVDLRAAPPDRVARALGVSTYEAAQRSRRGGHHLHRIVPLSESAHHAETVTAGGLGVLVVPEADVRSEE